VGAGAWPRLLPGWAVAGRVVCGPTSGPPTPPSPRAAPLSLLLPAHHPPSYEFIKQNNFVGLSLNLVRRFASQMLQSLK
jgi:hypothetical protein